MKAILNPDGTFRELVDSDKSTAPDRTRMWVPTEPPVPGADEVVEEIAPLIDDTTATQRWAVRAKTRDELVPAEVPFGAFVAALELAGVNPADVAARIEQIPDIATRIVVRYKWNRATVALRDDPVLRQFGADLGFTDAQMDQLFVVAKQIW